MKMKLSIIKYIFIMVIILSACSPTKQLSEAISSPQPETEIQQSHVTQPPTNTPKVSTRTTKPSALDLILTGKQGFIQQGISGTLLFEVENLNEGYAIESSEYQITIYDASGTVLKTDNGYISLVLPKEKTFIAVDFFLEEGQIADRIEVQIKSGKPEELELTEPPFSVGQAEFVPDDYFPKVTGVVNNLLNRNVSDMRVTAVAFDESGEVIGGGYKYLNFLPPNGQAAVDININLDQNPASVQIYATISAISFFTEEDLSEGGLVLRDFGFTQDGTSAGVAFLVQNTNTNSAIESSQYRVEAYDTNGTVLDTEEGYIHLVYPGEISAEFADLFLPDGTTIEKVVVQISQGEPTSTPYDQNPLAADRVTYIPGDYFDYVTATITSSASQTVEDIKIVAVGFDDAQKIIGGGYTYLDFVHAGGTSGTKISFMSSQAPAKIAVYPSLTSISTINAGRSESAVELVDFGFGISNNSVGVGFLVKNTETNSAVESTRFIVAAYDAEGSIIDEESGYIDVIFPEQIIAGSAELTIPSEKILHHVDVQLLSGNSEPVPASGYPFSIENVSYFEGGYSPKVTGIVKSSLPKDIDMIKVIAIAFDANDKIIGSGYTYVDFVPANGQSAVEMTMIVTGTPARVELYPTFSSLSDISD
jgi:hypothetical protein